MPTIIFRTALVASLFSLALFGCKSTYRDVGPYRIVVATDGFGGLFCQPRTEFYFVDSSSRNTKPTYLGTCGTPRFVTKHLHMPGDPSCFAVSEDGSWLVYFHLPKWCGAGEKAKQKSGGVYLHSIKEGDRLLYRDQDQVNQLWSSEDIGQHSIRVRWVGALPSRSGAICPQSLVINADGSEQPEGNAGAPDSRCQGWRDTAGSR
jgi:hypothetical protein